MTTAAGSFSERPGALESLAAVLGRVLDDLAAGARGVGVDPSPWNGVHIFTQGRGSESSELTARIP